MASGSYAFRSGFMRSDFPIIRIQFGSCEILPHTREIFVNGQVRAVEPKVFDLMLYLAMERDRVVLKEELLEHLWTGVFVSESVLGRTVMKARKVLDGAMHDCPVIKTMHGIGYQFVAPVEVIYDTVPTGGKPIGLAHLPLVVKPYINEEWRKNLTSSGNPQS